jgi:hypothetical protein
MVNVRTAHGACSVAKAKARAALALTVARRTHLYLEVDVVQRKFADVVGLVYDVEDHGHCSTAPQSALSLQAQPLSHAAEQLREAHAPHMPSPRAVLSLLLSWRWRAVLWSTTCRSCASGSRVIQPL